MTLRADLLARYYERFPGRRGRPPNRDDLFDLLLDLLDERLPPETIPPKDSPLP